MTIEERREYGREYYYAHRSKMLEQRAQYHQLHKAKKLEYNKKYNQLHKRDIAKQYWQHRTQLKLEVIKQYGNGICACVKCSFTDIRALSIDHIDGNGAKHMRAEHIVHGNSFYVWLKKNNFPEGYQSLCMNCQYIKRFENKECGEIDAGKEAGETEE